MSKQAYEIMKQLNENLEAATDNSDIESLRIALLNKHTNDVSKEAAKCINSGTLPHGFVQRLLARHGFEGIALPEQAVKKPCGCGSKTTATTNIATRPSCIECVEKHIGAAYVLLTETRDGYAYRLRVIGHLHEAEDESQEWPELHNAIRDARKNWQTQGAMPDWQALENLVKKIRDSQGPGPQV